MTVCDCVRENVSVVFLSVCLIVCSFLRLCLFASCARALSVRAYVCVRACALVSVRTRVQVSKCVCVYMCARLHACVHVFLHACLYACVHVCA